MISASMARAARAIYERRRGPEAADQSAHEVAESIRQARADAYAGLSAALPVDVLARLLWVLDPLSGKKITGDYLRVARALRAAIVGDEPE